MHLGPVFGAERLGTVMTTVRQIRPDLIVLSGDIIDGDISARYAEEYLDSLSTLRSRHGTIAVIGNHEEYFGINRISELYKTDGIQLMRDTLVTLGDEIEVAGVDDYGAARDLSNRRKLNNVIAGRASGLPLILLGHDPTFFEDEAERGVVLQLSGHTHGGQFVPLNILARLKFKHISGLSMHKRSYLYVSNGIGTRGPLMRLLARSEISVIQLRGPHNRP
jgi:predicted MPP superfamily phosphohydrolase